MLDFTLEIMERISEEDKKMSGSWICLLPVVCKWFEGPVTLPLSLPNMFVVPWKWLMGSVSNKFARAPKFCFRTDWRREYPRARTVTYLVMFLKSMGADSPSVKEWNFFIGMAEDCAMFHWGKLNCITCKTWSIICRPCWLPWLYATSSLRKGCVSQMEGSGMMNGLSPKFAANTGWPIWHTWALSTASLASLVYWTLLQVKVKAEREVRGNEAETWRHVEGLWGVEIVPPLAS